MHSQEQQEHVSFDPAVVSASSAAGGVGPLHLRDGAAPRRSRRTTSMGPATAACLAAVLSLSTLSHVSAYSVQAPSRPTALTTTASSANVAGKLSARDILETARIIREERQKASSSSHSKSATSSSLQPDLYAQLFDATPDSIRRSIGLASSSTTSSKEDSSWTETLFDEPEQLNQELTTIHTIIESRVQDEVSAVGELTEATGSEIPDMELYLQMEAARRRAGHQAAGSAGSAAFIAGEHDVTDMEKLAMKAVPVQLPGPVLREAVSASTASTSTKSKSKKPAVAKKAAVKATASTATAATKVKGMKVKNGTSKTIKSKKATAAAATTIPKALKLKKEATKATKIAASISTPALTQPFQPKPPRKKGRANRELSPKTDRAERITPEEEIELARIVQRGSELHNLKSTFEAKHGRDITKKEWTELAGLDSPRELRRLVSNYRSAKNKLVASNMGLVYAVVRGKHGARLRASGIGEDELVQEGSMGLIRAAELFDPERGLRFSTYATIWIKGVLSNSKVDETITLPAREKTKWNKIRKAALDLARERTGGSDDAAQNAVNVKPKLKDVAKLTGLSEEDVERVTSKMEQAQKLLSLDYQYQTNSRSGADVSSHDGFDQDRALQVDADLVERLQIRADVIAALARNLTPDEARLMRLRYGLKDGISRSLAECAEAMGCSRDKARYLANGCLKKLREADEADSLQEYLLTVA